jgi:hypothetical protein
VPDKVPNWPSLRELAVEIETLNASDAWNRGAFERVFAEGEKARRRWRGTTSGSSSSRTRLSRTGSDP